jgi:hypothetical protein
LGAIVRLAIGRAQRAGSTPFRVNPSSQEFFRLVRRGGGCLILSPPPALKLWPYWLCFPELDAPLLTNPSHKVKDDVRIWDNS